MYSSLYLLIPKLLTSLSSCLFRVSLMPQMVKHLPAMQETQVPSLDQENPLEKWMATHSSIIAWRIPGTEEPGRLQSQGLQRIGDNRAANTFTACFPFGNHKHVFYVCESVSVLWKSSFVSYLLCHLWVILYNACLSLSELLHSVWLSVGPSMLSQMVLFLFMAE